MRKAVFALVCLIVVAMALPAMVALASGSISENQVTQWREGDLVVYPLAYPLSVDYGNPVAIQLVVINATPSHAVYLKFDNTTLALNQTRYYDLSVSLDPGVHSFAVLTNYSVLYSTLFRIVVPPLPPPPEPTLTFTLAQLLDLRTGIAQTAMVAGLVGGVVGAGIEALHEGYGVAAAGCGWCCGWLWLDELCEYVCRCHRCYAVHGNLLLWWRDVRIRDADEDPGRQV